MKAAQEQSASEVEALRQELRLREGVLRALSFAADRFLRSDDPAEHMDRVLELLGQATDVSRIYIFQNHLDPEGTLLTSMRYEWTAEGVEPQIDAPELQNAPFHPFFTRWERYLVRGEAIQGHVRDFPEGERELLEPQGIKTLLVVPVFVGQRWWGFMGFDETRAERTWTEVVVEALNAAADTLGSAIQRRDTEVVLRQRESQLQQAQRMEAVGRLTGAIAHDFNNLLTAIGGFATLALEELPAGSSPAADVEEIEVTVGKARGLTRRLLDFSRQQVVEAELLDLNQVIRGMEGLVRRLIAGDITLTLDLDPELGMTFGDRTQIEQVLVNLLVNARDAVSSGGRILLRTDSWDAPWEEFERRGLSWTDGYLRLSVIDNGVGMAPEVAARAFEPFFSTKAPGKGTGFGLSTVHSIVRQLGGAVEVETAPGEGAAFHVLLPMVVRAPGEETDEQVPDEAPGTGRGTVLVVDDAEPVREVTRRLLEEAGYRTLAARDLRTAADQAALLGDELTLLLTDVFLPDGNGAQVWEAVRKACPGARVLFMSGYGPVGLGPGVSDRDRERILDKPFRSAQLLHRVREVLES